MTILSKLIDNGKLWAFIYGDWLEVDSVEDLESQSRLGCAFGYFSLTPYPTE